MNIKSKSFKIVAAILGIFVLIAFGGWVYQLMYGLSVTGMNNSVSWGTYIMLFMFFVGLSAGGLIVASSASIFNIKDFKKVALPAVILSIVCISLAGSFILIDLGGIQRIYNMLLTPNPTSPLVWDMIVITIYLVINILYLVFMVSKKADPKKVSIISRFALPTAILVHSVTAWIFGLQMPRPAWHTAIMAPIFVASALDSGLAMLIISLYALEKAKIIEVGEKLFKSLAGLLAIFIAVDAFFIGCEIITVWYGMDTIGKAHLAVLTTGVVSPFFWFEIIAGLAIPFLILVFSKNRDKMPLVLFSSALVVLGVLCKRIWLLFSGFYHPNFYGAPGIPEGSSAAVGAKWTDIWSLLGIYSPTTLEVFISIGVIAAGVLAFIILSNWLIPKEQKIKRKKAAATQGTEAPQTA